MLEFAFMENATTKIAEVIAGKIIKPTAQMGIAPCGICSSFRPCWLIRIKL